MKVNLTMNQELQKNDDCNIRIKFQLNCASSSTLKEIQNFTSIFFTFVVRYNNDNSSFCINDTI